MEIEQAKALLEAENKRIAVEKEAELTKHIEYINQYMTDNNLVIAIKLDLVDGNRIEPKFKYIFKPE